MTARRQFHAASRGIAVSALLCLAVAGTTARSVRAAEAPVLGAPVQRTLGNGLRVAVLPDSRLGLVQIQLLVPAGLAAEPKGSEGVAYVTAEMLRHGSTSRDPSTFANDVERMGGSITPNVGQDFSSLSGLFLSRDFEAAMELMSDGVIYPIFDDGELRRVQSQALRQIAQAQQNVRSAADDQAVRLGFGDHPYGRSTLGTRDGIESLDAARARAFWGDRWRPDRAVIAIAGDVTPERAFVVAEEWFGRWSGRSEAPVPHGKPAPIERIRIRIVDRPATLAELRVVSLGPARGDPDEMAIRAANALIGGTSGAGPRGQRTLLGRELRTNYSAFSDAGGLVISAGTAPDSVGEAATQIIAMLNALQQPVEPPDLAGVQKLMKNLFPMSLETLASRTSSWLAADFYGNAAEFFDRYLERVGELSPDAVAAAAKRWLDPAKIALVAVGPAAQIRPQLERLGAVEVVGADQLSASPAPSPEPAKAAVKRTAPTAAQRARGRELVRKALVAHGGLAKLRGIADSRIEAGVTLNIGGRKLEGDLIVMRREPDHMLYRTEIAGIATRQVLTGHTAWQLTGSDSVPNEVDSVGVAALESGFGSDLQHLLLAAADPKAVVFPQGREKIGAVNAWAVVVESPAHGVRTLYLDPVNYRLIAFDQGDAGDATGMVARRRFSDFRTVGGVLWPHREERLLNGETVMQVDVRGVRFNVGIPDQAFQKPDAGHSKPR